MKGLMICMIGLLVAVIFGSPVSAEPVLMGDWNLSQASVGLAPDSSGNGMNGDVYGSPTLIPGVGLHFDGVDDYIEIPNTSGWNFPNGFTIDATFRCNEPQIAPLDDTAIVSKHVSGQWAGYALTVFTPYGPPANELSFFVEPYTPYSRIYGPNVVNDNWHEAVAMYDGASLSLFLDGILVAQQTPCQYDGFSPANIRIGYYVPGTGDSTFFGDIGEVKIYDGAVPMPEPSTLVLLAISTIGVLGYAWRRRAAKQ